MCYPRASWLSRRIYILIWKNWQPLSAEYHLLAGPTLPCTPVPQMRGKGRKTRSQHTVRPSQLRWLLAESGRDKKLSEHLQIKEVDNESSMLLDDSSQFKLD